MNKKQAHEIAKKAAMAAYKVTMQKLAQDVDLMGAMKEEVERTPTPSPVKPAKVAPDGAPGTEVTFPEGGAERKEQAPHASPGGANSPLKPIVNPQTGTVTPAPKLVDFSKGASKTHAELLSVAAKYERTLKKYSK